MIPLSGSRILITGASTGIGAALAHQLHAAGARLALLSRQTELYTLPNARWFPVDLTLPAQREAAFAAALTHLGGIDVLINNAGAGAYAPTALLPEATWQHLNELNLNAPIHLTRLALPHLTAQRHGAIVNITSIAAVVPLPWLNLYSATKSALLTFTHGLRMELRGTGVSATAVCPGYVTTPFQSNALAGVPPPMLQRTRRFAISPERCAADIIHGFTRRRRTVHSPFFSNVFLHVLYRLLPGLVERQFAKYNSSPEPHQP